MPADTVRVHGRDVPLAELEEQAQHPSFRYNPQYEGCAVVVLALVAEVRALRAQVEDTPDAR